QLGEIGIDERQLAVAQESLDVAPRPVGVLEMRFVQARLHGVAKISFEGRTPSDEESARLRRLERRVALVHGEPESRAEAEKERLGQVEAPDAERVPHRGRSTVQALAVHEGSIL